MKARAVGVALVVIWCAASPAFGRTAAVPVPIPRGDLLAIFSTGVSVSSVSVLASSGRVVATLPPLGSGRIGSIALGADRRHLFESVQVGEQIPELYDLDLTTGARRLLASGVAPAVSPDGSSLAYLAVADDPLVGERRITGLAIRNLQSGATRLIPRPDGPDTYRQPDGPINWSPNGQTIALFDGSVIRLVAVAVATATDLASQPTVPGDVPNHPISKRVYPPQPTQKPPPGMPSVPVITITPPLPVELTATSRAPAFLDNSTLVAVYDCCIGYSHLAVFDLRTGKHTTFATLYGPPEDIVRLGMGQVLVVTAAGYLDLVSKGVTRQIAARVIEATG